MASTWYKASKYTDRIDSVTVERDTDSSIWINGRRSAKATAYEQYFPTWYQACGYLLSRTQSKIAYLERELEQEKSRLDKIGKMHPPTT